MKRYKSNIFKSLVLAASISIGLGTVLNSYASSGNHWRSAHGNIQNTSNAGNSAKITSSNVGTLKVQWTYLTTPDILDGSGRGANGSVHSTPSVAGKYLYFTDATGKITALNRKTGAVIWSKRFVEDISDDGEIYYSRNTPAISGGKVVVGGTFHFASRPCIVDQALGYPGLVRDGVLGSTSNTQNGFNCHKTGAYVVALNRFTGEKIWQTMVSDHPASKISGSPTISGNTVFVPVGGWEEEFTRSVPNIFDLSNYPAQTNLLSPSQIDPTKPYPCCSSTGQVVALDLNSGSIKWSTDLAIGVDTKNQLSSALKAALGPKGYFGASTYGDNPAVDLKRGNVYVSTANMYTAPPIMRACEVARRQFLIANPTNTQLSQLAPPNNLQLPTGVSTCNDLNKAFKSYGGAIVALDSKTGNVKWAFYARQYDSWVHACDPPTLTVPWLVPVLNADPLANLGNCPELVGPDYGFGNQPMLIKNVTINGQQKDLVVAGNKDGFIYAVDPSSGALVWKKMISPGGLYGGIQFGMATDGVRIFAGVSNSDNTMRKINREFRPLQEFLDLNYNNNPNFTALGSLKFKTGLINNGDGTPTEPRPAPSDAFIPFPGPQISLASLFPGVTLGAGYPNDYPLFVNNQLQPNTYTPYLTGPTSGPRVLWELINPPVNPPDAITSDCVNIFDRPINRNNPAPDVSACQVGVTAATRPLYTIAGIITAVSAANGDILWQRPAVDGIGPNVTSSAVSGSVTVANDVVFVGYSDFNGTLVGLDTKTGTLKFKYNANIVIDTLGTKKNSGVVASGPSVVKGHVYWGIGHDTFGPFNPNAPGNRVYSFELSPESDSDYELYSEQPSAVEDEDWQS